MNKQISLEHLNNLQERLEVLMNTSEERGRYLDFEQTHWRVQVYFVQLEYFVMALDKKQGDLHQTEKLYQEYKVYRCKPDLFERILLLCSLAKSSR